jgi:hypothetical protein
MRAIAGSLIILAGAVLEAAATLSSDLSLAIGNRPANNSSAAGVFGAILIVFGAGVTIADLRRGVGSPPS